MTNHQVVGRFYALPAAREFELHPVAAAVLSGRIARDIPADRLALFNGTGVLCSCIVGGDPLTLSSIEAAPAGNSSD